MHTNWMLCTMRIRSYLPPFIRSIRIIEKYYSIVILFFFFFVCLHLSFQQPISCKTFIDHWHRRIKWTNSFRIAAATAVAILCLFCIMAHKAQSHNLQAKQIHVNSNNNWMGNAAQTRKLRRMTKSIFVVAAPMFASPKCKYFSFIHFE